MGDVGDAGGAAREGGGRVVAIVDSRFDHDSCIGEGVAAEVGPFVTGIVVADANKSTLLAVERMLNFETLAAAVAARGEVWQPRAVAEGYVV